MSLEAGSHIGHYRLERRLGTGGMGAVYLARDTRLDRLVAIKLLVAPTEEGRRRLLREARAVAKLDHPGICAVHEVGHDPAAGDFIAMQYVEGETLEARIRRSRPRPDETLAIAGHIAEALVAAHRHGIVHRDLKPGNVIITPSGAPKLLDFGLATHVAGSAGAASALTATQVTDPGVVVGTPAYMSPEQVRNETADVRSDVFSLGAVIYECLTGRRPFGGSTNAEIMGEVLHVDPPPVSSVVSEIGPAYDTLCARLLAKRPAERFQSAEEVLGAIRTLVPSTRLVTTGIVAPPAPRWSRARGIAIAAAVVGVVALGWWMWRPGSLPTPSDDARRWYDRGVEAMRDGTYVAARVAFGEAVRLFPRYAQAYPRLAEAYAAIDDERNAQKALLEGNTILPDQSGLGREDRLRQEAASQFALRHFDAAVVAYEQLAVDAGSVIDLGRAQEAAGRRNDARASYEKAVGLDRQSAAAHLRLGILQAQTGLTKEGLASIDEAIRLYQLAAKPEGEAQAFLSKGVALSVLSQFSMARENLERVLKFAEAGSQYAAQAIGADIQLARVEFFSGSFTGAEELARRAVARASDAGLQTLAAAGFLTLGNTLLGARRYEAADAQYVKAIELAALREARRVEHRARLQQASLRLQMGRFEEALALAQAPLKYFEETKDARLLVTAKNVAARALVRLERDTEARRLIDDALQFAEGSQDQSLVATALETLAGLLAATGQQPVALTHRERIETIHRNARDTLTLPFDLANRADLLAVLGRAPDAEPALAELAAGIAAGTQSFLPLKTRVARANALVATFSMRHADVIKAAVPPADLFGRVITEHALARLGRSRTLVSELAAWLVETESPADRAEFSYWVAQTLRARKEFERAHQVASSALASSAAQKNPEVAWRLAAVAALCGRVMPTADKGASMAALSRENENKLRVAWAGAASLYFARPDIAALRAELR